MSVINVIPYIDVVYLLASGLVLDTILTSELKSKVSWVLAGLGAVIVLGMIFLMGTHSPKEVTRVVTIERSLLF